MKRKAAKDRLGGVFLEAQGQFKRRRYNHTNDDEDTQAMDVLVSHVDEIRELYANNQADFIEDLVSIRTEAERLPNLFTTEREFWDFLFSLIGRTRYPLLTMGKCCTCLNSEKLMNEPVLKALFCDDQCQLKFYEMFNMSV